MASCTLCDRELTLKIDEYGPVHYPLCIRCWFDFGPEVEEISKIQAYTWYSAAKERLDELRVYKFAPQVKREIDKLEDEIENLEDEIENLEDEISEIRRRIRALKTPIQAVTA